MGNQRSTGPRPRPDSVQPQQPESRPKLDLTVAKLTDVGRVRDHNEDYVDYYVPSDPQQLASKGALYLVADGMGGHQAGEVASQGAVELVRGQYYSDTTHDIGTSLVRAFRAANQQIYERAQTDASKTGMGTTLVAAVILGSKVYVANVGDSRAYLISPKGISRITVDHSWVEEQVQAGLLTREEARRHPQRNVVTRALGSKPAVEVDLFEGELQVGHTLFMCTDGLTGHVEDREIASIVRQHPPEEAARLLVAQANERGGSDNIGMIVASAQKQAAAAMVAPVTPVSEPKPARKLPLIPLLAGLAALLIVVFGGLLIVPPLIEGKPTAAVVAQVSDTVTPQPAATETASPLVPAETPIPPTDEVSNPTAGPTADPAEPTSTLVPTTEAATPVPTPTRQPTEQPGASPTAKPTATEKAEIYPAPTLGDPKADESLDGVHTHLFTWSYPGPELKEGEAFDLRIWSEEKEPDKLPSDRRGAMPPTRIQEAQVNLRGAPAIAEHGGGRYRWAVAVVQVPSCYPGCPLKVISVWSEERPFTYAPPGGGGDDSDGGNDDPGWDPDE